MYEGITFEDFLKVGVREEREWRAGALRGSWLVRKGMASLWKGVKPGRGLENS